MSLKLCNRQKISASMEQEMQAYCKKTEYNHQFLIVGEVTAAKDFVGKWWDLRKEMNKATSSISESFDATEGLSLAITYAGTTTKNESSISSFGQCSKVSLGSPFAKLVCGGAAINTANGKVWAGDSYDYKSYVDLLANQIVGQ